MIRYFALFALLLIPHSVDAQNFTNSKLPIVIITTDINPGTGQPARIPDDPKVMGSMKIIYRPDSTRNFLSDSDNTAFLNYNGRIGIELRGSTTQQFLAKKSYGLTTLLSDNISHNNVPILNMPAENDWVLNALGFDPSLIRDYLSYSLYGDLGNYSPGCRFCELMVNGDYKGLYIFMEKIKSDGHRVNIVKMKSVDNALPDVSGGYITKCDKTTGGDPVAWTLSSYSGMAADFIHENPQPDDVTTQQNAFIYNQFLSLKTTTNSHNESLSDGYPTIIDIPSFIDFFILNELASNVDGYQLSTFFHKDRNGKLRAGPIWDFNLTYGNDLFDWGLDRSKTNVWQFDDGGLTGAKFWKDLFANTTFKCYLSKRWSEVTADTKLLNYQVISNKIDQMVSLTSEASVRDKTRWGTAGNRGIHIAGMKTWLQARINWMNTRLSNYSACSNPTIPALVISQIHYHPLASGAFSSDDLEFIQITNNCNVIVNLSGIYFKELGITYSFPYNSVMGAHEKIYLAGKSASFQQYYGFLPFGEFTRNMSNKSEKLVLADAFGNIIDYVEYMDTDPWPVAADGTGAYLQLADLNYDNSLASSWIASNEITSTPFIGMNETDIGDGFSIFPNPAHSFITVSNNNLSVLSYQISDLAGRKLSKIVEINSRIVTITVEDLFPGIYFIRFHFTDGSEVVRKLVKI